MNIEGTFPKNLEERGVMDKDVLPVFPYRDDGLLLYNAIKTYVTKIINYFYGRSNYLFHGDGRRTMKPIMMHPSAYFSAFSRR